MPLFSTEEIDQGAGAFEYVMRNKDALAGPVRGMPPGVAVGIVASAMRCGVPRKRLEEVLGAAFPNDTSTLIKVLNMHEGDDWRLDCWKHLEGGRYKLRTELVRQSYLSWRYVPPMRDDDF